MGASLPAGRLRLLVLAGMFALVQLCAAPAAAQYTRDAAANREISKAITGQYLKMEFERAEQQLLGILRACGQKCRPSTLAKAWMYVGVVRGSGKEDLAGAREAFDTAFAADPEVELDDALATSGTREAYAAARKAKALESKPRAMPLLGGATKGESGAIAEAEVEQPAAAALTCTPHDREVQTRRPVPIECRGDAEAARASLRYQQRGATAWKSLEMKRSGDAFRAQIPCEDSMDAGVIHFFVVVTDSSGDPVETLGSKSAPERLRIEPNSQSVPAFEGEDAPARCEEKVLCPPDFPGCEDGTSGVAAEDDDRPAREYRKNWLGLHFAPDIGFIQGSDVCATGNDDFECFAGGSPYPSELPAGVSGEPGELGDPYPGTGISSGASGGTLRALISYDHALSERLSLGGRVGYAFGGGPASANGRSFLPVHAEARIQYWLRPLSASGLLPYVHLGGGLAQVDIKKGGVTVQDCSSESTRQAFLDCIGAANDYDSGNDPALPRRTLDSYRRLGNGFGTAGGGVLVPLGGSVALQLNLNAMLMLPSVGLVLQPSIGIGYAL